MITYLVGDATDPLPGEPGMKVIVHICNDIGAWGRGFVLSLSKRWQKPEAVYRRWYQEQASLDGMYVPLQLGEIQFVRVEPEIAVVNMIAQQGILVKDGVQPIRYDALTNCFKNLTSSNAIRGASIHMPRIGCGLAGGKWSEIEPIIERELSTFNVYVYDFETGDARTIKWNK